MRYEFYGLQLDFQPDWFNVTADLPEGSPPTLAKSEGVGALQFSIGRYKSGKLPNITIGDLREILVDWCANLSVEVTEVVEIIRPNISLVECITSTDQHLLAVWFLSNRRDVVLATYTAFHAHAAESAVELIEARQTVQSIEF